MLKMHDFGLLNSKQSKVTSRELSLFLQVQFDLCVVYGLAGHKAQGSETVQQKIHNIVSVKTVFFEIDCTRRANNVASHCPKQFVKT